jgi:elongation factor Ts
VAASDEEAKLQAKPAYDLYVDTRLYAKKHVYEDIIANGICLFGSVDTVAEKMCRLHEMGIRHVATMHNFGALDPALVERERSIAMEKAKESGKPQNIIEKMVEGGLAKFRKDNALLSQLFVIDNKTPVAEVVASAAKQAGTGIVLKGFVRFQLGEGIEKKENDFAAEVAAAAGKAEPVS